MHRFDPTWPRHGLHFRPTWTHLAPTSDPGPMLQTPCDALKTSTFGYYYQRFLPCMGVRARSCCPDWACLGRPHRTKLHMLNPTCVQTCASCAMLDPSCWSQMPSSAQARPKLRPRTAKLDPSQLWLGQVGLLLSPLSYSLGASRSDSKINMVDSQFLTDFAA